MSSYNNKYNYHNSNIRSIIVAVAGEFSNKIKYNLYKADNEAEVINVPFYNSFTGSEDFIKDEFLNDELTNSTQKLDGMYNVIPRGILTFTGLDIDTASFVNRYTRTTIPKKVDATTYKMYSYETLILPINLTFDCTILCSSTIEMLNILEFGLLHNFYKSTPFYVDYGGYRVRGYINIPESVENSKQYEYSYSDRKTFDLTFSLDVNTYLPIFNDGTEIFLGQTMDKFDIGLFDLTAVPTNTIHSNTDNSIPNKEDNKLN